MAGSRAASGWGRRLTANNRPLPAWSVDPVSNSPSTRACSSRLDAGCAGFAGANDCGVESVTQQEVACKPAPQSLDGSQQLGIEPCDVDASTAIPGAMQKTTPMIETAAARFRIDMP